MDRRTVLRRIGAAAGASVVIGGGTGSASPGAMERAIDVSDVSGRVALSEVVEDPSAVVASGVDPSRVRLLVSESADVTTAGDCDTLDCCCKGCPSGCDSCTCVTCGPDACDDDDNVAVA